MEAEELPQFLCYPLPFLCVHACPTMNTPSTMGRGEGREASRYAQLPFGSYPTASSMTQARSGLNSQPVPPSCALEELAWQSQQAAELKIWGMKGLLWGKGGGGWKEEMSTTTAIIFSALPL